MKKLISLIIALVCMLSLFACEGGGSSKTIRELTPSGEEVQADDMRKAVAQRRATYLEADLAKAEEENDRWFDMEIKMSMIVKDGESETEVFYKIDGKMGLVDMSELVMDVDILLEAEEVTYDEASNKETATMEVKGTLILVDGMAYVDATAKEVTPDGEKEEHVKQMGSLEDAFEFADIEELLGVIGDPDSIYSLDVDQLLNMVAGGTNVKYYNDGDKIFIDYRDTLETTNLKSEEVVQYEIEYKKNSAIVKSSKAYTRNYIETSYYDGVQTVTSIVDMKLGVQVTQISSASIKAPDLEGYERV